jgi:hypothetical protein
MAIGNSHTRATALPIFAELALARAMARISRPTSDISMITDERLLSPTPFNLGMTAAIIR